ncbi:unnamed protein product [Cuscuta epithymum]|uniref:Uncharacterized protein n=1 Tax=Cuscuta epithymum TaxID=186058 RepID=A0AAV0GH59_9ASTE|nr:unnamed protein product [Cuscuta epithymum]
MLPTVKDTSTYHDLPPPPPVTISVTPAKSDIGQTPAKVTFHRSGNCHPVPSPTSPVPHPPALRTITLVVDQLCPLHSPNHCRTSTPTTLTTPSPSLTAPPLTAQLRSDHQPKNHSRRPPRSDRFLVAISDLIPRLKEARRDGEARLCGFLCGEIGWGSSLAATIDLQTRRREKKKKKSGGDDDEKCSGGVVDGIVGVSWRRRLYLTASEGL